MTDHYQPQEAKIQIGLPIGMAEANLDRLRTFHAKQEKSQAAINRLLHQTIKNLSNDKSSQASGEHILFYT